MSQVSVTRRRFRVLDPEILCYGDGARARAGGEGSRLVFTVKVTLHKINRLILSEDTIMNMPDNANSVQSSGTLSIDPYHNNKSSWHQSLRLLIRNFMINVDHSFENSILREIGNKVNDMIRFHDGCCSSSSQQEQQPSNLGRCRVHLTVALELNHDVYQPLGNEDKEAEVRRSLKLVQAGDYMEVDGEEEEEEEEEDKCGICLEEMLLNKNKRKRRKTEEAKEEVASLPCQHAFHDGCVVKWLKIKPFCPLCRFKLPVAATKPRRKWRTIRLS